MDLETRRPDGRSRRDLRRRQDARGIGEQQQPPLQRPRLHETARAGGSITKRTDQRPLHAVRREPALIAHIDLVVPAFQHGHGQNTVGDLLCRDVRARDEVAAIPVEAGDLLRRRLHVGQRQPARPLLDQAQEGALLERGVTRHPIAGDLHGGGGVGERQCGRVGHLHAHAARGLERLPLKGRRTLSLLHHLARARWRLRRCHARKAHDYGDVNEQRIPAHGGSTRCRRRTSEPAPGSARVRRGVIAKAHRSARWRPQDRSARG
jgi:hypothetical protein